MDDFQIHSSLKAGKLSEGLKAIDWLPLPLLRRLSSLRFDKDLLCKFNRLKRISTHGADATHRHEMHQWVSLPGRVAACVEPQVQGERRTLMPEYGFTNT